MNRYTPPEAEVADIGASVSNHHLLRNMAALVIGLPVSWLAIMGSRFLVRVTHGYLPSFLTGKYSIGVAEFLTALPAAVSVGALAYLAFVGTWRQAWWWGLSIALFFLALAAIEPLLPDGSSRSLAIMSFLEFSSFLLIGLTASSIRRLLAKRRVEPAA
jgi:hypothetical protein